VDALTWPVVDRLVARFDVLIALLAMRATRSIVLEELHQGHYNAPVGAAVEEPATKTARKTIKSVKMCPSAGSECNARLLGAKKNNHCGCSSLFETVHHFIIYDLILY
jgi:hypothetical protein